MAYRRPSPCYRLVDNGDELRRSLRQLNRLDPGTILAVDCEGVNLSREGDLTIVTVATTQNVYIFDVAALDDQVFNQGLRDILEDSTREKLMFDCREDSDALWHQYRVKLSGVLDVQLFEVMYRRSRQHSFSRSTGTRDDVECINGFGQCLRMYVKDKHAIKTKDIGKRLMQRDHKIWKRRPLSDTLIQYCAVDTQQIFNLFSNLLENWRGNKQEIPDLRIASERYADMHRRKAARRLDKYEKNAFLPVEIISHEGVVYRSCEGCQRSLPKREFPFGTQKCSVCREIDKKTPKDDKNHEYYEDESEENEYDRYDDDDDDDDGEDDGHYGASYGGDYKRYHSCYR